MILKAVFMFFVLTLSLASQAKASLVTLTTEDQNAALQRLNDICGDIWCEGDYEIDFVSVQVESALGEPHYKLTMDVSKHETDAKYQKNVVCDIQSSKLFENFLSNLKSNQTLFRTPFAKAKF